jgi:hypothetical protein
MRKGLFWIGIALCVIGVGVVVASVVFNNPTYNLGDPGRFQFILVPFWLVGLVVAVLGAVAVLIARRRAATAGGS